MKESDYSKYIVKLLKGRGAVVNVNTASIYDTVGRADVEACYKGYYLAFELKTGNYQPDPLQIEYLKDIRNAGGIGLLLRDNEGVAELIKVLSYIDNEVMHNYHMPKLPYVEVSEVVYD